MIELRKRVIFKIIPILNVDGVVVGNSRTGFAGLFFTESASDK